MKIVVLLVAVFTIVSAVGISSPDSVMTARRLYCHACRTLYGRRCSRCYGTRGALFAPRSRAQDSACFAELVCAQGLAATAFELIAHAILEWEAIHTALLRSGAVVAVPPAAVAYPLQSRPGRSTDIQTDPLPYWAERWPIGTLRHSGTCDTCRSPNSQTATCALLETHADHPRT
jgi:hypothetical protein